MLGIKRKNGNIGDPLPENSYESNDKVERDTEEESSKISFKARRGSSKYHAVSWHSKKRKWQAQFKINGQNIWCGTHALEIDAARAVNERCDALGIERKNPTVNVLSKKEKRPPSPTGSSRYVAVYLVKESGKWRAHFSYKKKKHSCGTHLSEIDAAHAVNRKCDELGIARKNPKIGDYPSTDTESETYSSSDSETDDSKVDNNKKDQSQRKSSYVSVYWNKLTLKWRASFNYLKETHYCGTFVSDTDAAHAVNRKCDELGIPRRNPGIGSPPSLDESASEIQEDEEESLSKFEEVQQLDESGSKMQEDEEESSSEFEEDEEFEEQKKTSKYKAVYYIKARDTWYGTFTSGGEKQHCGEHATDFNAALAVNRRCDQLRITRKNPEIGERISENASNSESDSESEQIPSKDFESRVFRWIDGRKGLIDVELLKYQFDIDAIVASDLFQKYTGVAPKSISQSEDDTIQRLEAKSKSLHKRSAILNQRNEISDSDYTSVEWLTW